MSSSMNPSPEEEPLETRVERFLRAPGYRPMDVSGIARGMELAAGERADLRALLRRWQTEGRLLRLRQARLVLKDVAEDALTGRVRQIAPARLLFIPNSEGQERIRALAEAEGEILEFPIPSHRSMGAMEGDTVKARLRRRTPPRYRRHHKGLRPMSEDLRWEARVEEIIERRPGLWIGIYRPGEKGAYMKGDGRTCPEWVHLTGTHPPGLLAGMRIAVSPRHYPLGNMQAEGHIEEVLGWPGDTDTDITALQRCYGLRDTFPDTVLNETKELPPAPSPSDEKQRQDWRNRCVVTIDPATARDYDDAISVAEQDDGWELAVHIADVSYYVRPGRALDHEACLRGNSTYFPDRVLPMLPPRLCDDLCSLKEGENRLTMLCLMSVTRDGSIRKATFSRALISSRRRLDYATVQSLHDEGKSTGDEVVDTMLRQAFHLAKLLRSKRMKHGALDLDMPELRVKTDEQGAPVDICVEKADEAHQMIEEFMLAANEQAAHLLRIKLSPALYRVHEAPDPARLQEWGATLRSYGIRAGSLATREEICQALQEVNQHPNRDTLRKALLKSLMRARYSPRPLGHYGLNKGDYCHFTSPIRRYADLIVHRALARLCGESPTSTCPPPARWEDLASHLSDTERTSAAAEREATRLLLIRYLQKQSESPTPRHWQALITETWPQGLSVEVPLLQLSGFISGAELGENTTWYYERHAHRWSSTDGRFYLPGQQLDVVPVRVERETGFTDFRPA